MVKYKQSTSAADLCFTNALLLSFYFLLVRCVPCTICIISVKRSSLSSPTTTIAMAPMMLQLRQYLHFRTSKASKVSTGVLDVQELIGNASTSLNHHYFAAYRLAVD